MKYLLRIAATEGTVAIAELFDVSG